MNRNRTYTIALGGISLGLSIAFLYTASFVPAIEMLLFAICGIFVPLMVIESGVKGGALVYGGVILLGLLIVPNKWAVLIYGMFFGLYGLVKYFAEKPKKLVLQLILKLIFFLIDFFILWFFFSEIFFGRNPMLSKGLLILLPGGILFFLLYDRIITLMILLYRKRIKREDKIRLS